jgi:hydrogenase-1 operon protein HyaF
MNGSAHRALNAIAVQIEHSSGNIEPLLHEIRHALTLLLNVGATTCIDLKGMPLAPGEEARIMEALGTGEVRATITASGSSEVAETAYPGVWLVSHFNEEGQTQGRFIEITSIPEILRSQTSDMADGLARLKSRLDVT